MIREEDDNLNENMRSVLLMRIGLLDFISRKLRGVGPKLLSFVGRTAIPTLDMFANRASVTRRFGVVIRSTLAAVPPPPH